MSFLQMFIYILVGYIVLVLVAEVLIWCIQPKMDGIGVTLIITRDDGTCIVRNLAGFEYNNQIYVASNHWFRRWCKEALKSSGVEVIRGEVTSKFIVKKVSDEEHQRLSREYKMGIALRLICGFAPSRFLRLEVLS